VRQFPETRFLIVGEVLEKEYVNELRRLVDELGLTKYLRFEAGQTDLRQHLTEADIFVLPSRSEGFSNAIIEAMASSLPVVATDVGGNSEAVADGASGFIAPPNDAEALADAVISLLSDPARARAMGLSGRKTVEEKFSMEIMVKQVARAYTRLLHD
jgi:L-malate glycosyltransferase